MSEYFRSAVQSTRDKAKANAVAMLVDRGFRPENGSWIGTFDLDDRARACVRVKLPESFPDALPEVFLVPPPSMPIAHVDRRGKICIGPDTGALLDWEHPTAIVAQALDNAMEILVTPRETQALEIAREFSAYWEDTPNCAVISLCALGTAGGVLVASKLRGTGWIVAATQDSLDKWLKAVGRPRTETNETFLVRLTELPEPPRLQSDMTLHGFLEIVHSYGRREDSEELAAWLRDHGLPALVLCASQLPRGAGQVLFCTLVPQPLGKAAERSRAGFRAGHVPPALQVARAKHELVERPKLHRADAQYLLERAGGDATFLSKSVLLAGCGSIGSYLAQALCTLGIGTINLVDYERLALENTHRHLLGVSDVGEPKATALAETLGARYPHLKIAGHATRIENYLDRAFAPATTDLVVIAVGDETLERTLNRVLHPVARRLHVCVEPLGLGGHLLAAGGGPGCFDCLYRRDEEFGLINMASLVAPGQRVQRNVAGCSGTFTPFGGLDAEQAALNAAREVARMLGEDAQPPFLTSWCGSKSRFVAAGHALSKRGADILPNSFLRTDEFSQPSCPVCGTGSA